MGKSRVSVCTRVQKGLFSSSRLCSSSRLRSATWRPVPKNYFGPAFYLGTLKVDSSPKDTFLSLLVGELPSSVLVSQPPLLVKRVLKQSCSVPGGNASPFSLFFCSSLLTRFPTFLKLPNYHYFKNNKSKHNRKPEIIRWREQRMEFLLSTHLPFQLLSTFQN